MDSPEFHLVIQYAAATIVNNCAHIDDDGMHLYCNQQPSFLTPKVYTFLGCCWSNQIDHCRRASTSCHIILELSTGIAYLKGQTDKKLNSKLAFEIFYIHILCGCSLMCK